MAEALEIDRRSVYRMINVMEELGFPLYDDRSPLEKEKRWLLQEDYLKKLPNMKIPDIMLTLPEIISLYLLRSEANVFQGTELEAHMKSAFGKLGFFLPENAFDQLDRIKALFVPSSKLSKDYSGKEEIIEQLMDSMLKRQTCIVSYHSFKDDKVKGFKIDPLHFFESKGGLYLMVRATTFGDIRTLAVERIQEIKGTGLSFEYPKDLDPQALLSSAFDMVYGDPIDVRIWFSAEEARYIKERRWSKTQNIEEQEDGSVILSMTTSGWRDVKSWVLSFGAQAKVLEPKELREEIAEELQSAASQYHS
jgi:predicted DNA-binding transcriptional regulator YafY